MKPLTFRRALRMAWGVRWRAVATVMLPVYSVSLIPSSAWALSPTNTLLFLAKPVVTLTRGRASTGGSQGSSYQGPYVPANPSDADISYSHAFPEPLVPLGSKTSTSENEALGGAIRSFLQRKDDEDVSAITDYLEQYPDSAWRASLDLNLAQVDFKTGNFSKAMEAWGDAWARTQSLTDPTGQKIANFAVGQLAEMKARIGRTDELDALFKEIKGRDVSGSAAQLLVQARSGLWLMKNRPQDAFRCGPSALQELSLATKHKISHPELIKGSRSTPNGIALTDVQALAGKIDMPMQMAKRSEGSTFIVPAVIHWKLGHYAALVGQKDGKYVVHDTTFGGAQFLISARTLEQETSGYFLVPKGALPKGWSSVSRQEGSNVFGRGNPGDDDPYCLGPTDVNSGDGDCGNGGVGDPETLHVNDNVPWSGDPDGDADYSNPSGDANWAGGDSSDMPDSETAMSVPIVKSMLVSLGLVDTPIRYIPPLGPIMHFTVHYNQRDIAQPTTFSYANLGPNWTYSYLSYLTPNSTYVSLYQRGGGNEFYYYNQSTNSYSAGQKSGALVTQLNTTTWQKQYPGGEIETFGQPDGAGDYFLTQITDAQGNSLTLNYDSSMRLVNLVDAVGQKTVITYSSGTSGTPGYYMIYQVTDPFGRSATFNYDGSGRLQSITDMLQLQSSYTYAGSSTFINSLTTPYGMTTFAFGDNSTDPTLATTRWEETTYPDGNKDRTEYNETQTPLDVGGSGGDQDLPGIPSGMYSGSGTNHFMEYRNTYYWDRQAMASYPGNYQQAQVTHWLHTSDINTCSDIQESIKKPDQNRIWFAYAGQISSYQASNTMLARPTQRGRILGTARGSGGPTQLYTYSYNSLGKITEQTDPLGRETQYIYYPNNIDLETVQESNPSSPSGTGFDTLASYTYNSQHEVLTATDASGQVTHYYYYANGELQKIVDALGRTTTYYYNSLSELTQIVGPVSGATTNITYDSFGRVYQVTDYQGYITTTTYDAADRPVLVSYSDGTTYQTTYHNLDVQSTKDRLGQLTRYFYNSLRQQVAVLDAQGHVINTSWSLSAGPSHLVDSLGRTTTWIYDTENRLSQKVYPNSTNKIITYEPSTSRVHSVTDANGQVETMTYATDNAVTGISFTNATVSTGSVAYVYDSNYPRVYQMIDSTGTTTFNYNTVNSNIGSNLLGSLQTPLATISYTYDALGRRLSQAVNDSATGQGLTNSTSSVSYDPLGRVQYTTNPLSGTGTFSYAFLNNTGRITSVTNPNGQSTTFKYLDSSQTPNNPWLSEIDNLNASGNVISKFDYAYNKDNEITSWTQRTDNNDPQNWSIQYDGEGKVTSIAVTDTVTNSVLHQYAYLYDAAGNRTTEQMYSSSTGSTVVTGSTYNNANQLTGQSTGANTNMFFAGNTGTISTLVTVNGNSATSAYSTNFSSIASLTAATNTVTITARDINGNTATNEYQVIAPAISSSYSYDNNGNLLSDGVHNFNWDAKNELVSIIYNSGSNAGNHTEFTYNGLGQRVQIVERAGTTVGTGSITSTKQYIWAGSGVLEERNASNQVTKRYFGQGEQLISGSSATNYFFTYDHLGSVREMIANDGATIAARYSYDPYGRVTLVSGTVSSDFQYAGMYQHSVSGLSLAQYRAYNPNLGRWLSRDPMEESAGLNLYSYGASDPLNFTDPTGLDPFWMVPGLPDVPDPSTIPGAGSWCTDNAPTQNPFGSPYPVLDDGGMTDETRDLFNILLLAMTWGGSLAVEGIDDLTGIALSKQVGEEGEAAVGITGPKTAVNVPGTTRIRIPDAITATTVVEVKNVASQGLTQQIADEIAIAQASGKQFILYVRPSTQLSGPLQQAVQNGQVVIRYIPGTQ